MHNDFGNFLSEIYSKMGYKNIETYGKIILSDIKIRHVI